MPISEKTIIHDLFTREIRPIRNWYEWLERWQEAINIEEMLGLLHVGFNVSFERGQYGEKEYDEIDRIIFYFTIADGWGDDYLLKRPTDSREEYRFGKDENGRTAHRDVSQLRQLLARKAFDILCLHFFRRELMGGGRYGDDFAYDWERVIASERLFAVILDFFKIAPEPFGKLIIVRNLYKRWPPERSHTEQQMVNFLINLAKFMWKWREHQISSWAKQEQKDQETKQNVEMRTRLDTAKPWMVEVLAKLGELKVLREWILDLNQSCLAKLKEIAFRNELNGSRHVVKERPVATLDEACFLGSPAAWFLKEHELKTREHKRLNDILEAQRQEKVLQQKIKKLTAK